MGQHETAQRIVAIVSGRVASVLVLGVLVGIYWDGLDAWTSNEADHRLAT